MVVWGGELTSHLDILEGVWGHHLQQDQSRVSHGRWLFITSFPRTVYGL